jgi:hypothetical protein
MTRTRWKRRVFSWSQRRRGTESDVAASSSRPPSLRIQVAIDIPLCPAGSRPGLSRHSCRRVRSRGRRVGLDRLGGLDLQLIGRRERARETPVRLAATRERAECPRSDDVFLADFLGTTENAPFEGDRAGHSASVVYSPSSESRAFRSSERSWRSSASRRGRILSAKVRGVAVEVERGTGMGGGSRTRSLPFARLGGLCRMSHAITAALIAAHADSNTTAIVGLPSGPTTPTTHATKIVPAHSFRCMTTA